jgi:hypothetical protein
VKASVRAILWWIVFTLCTKENYYLGPSDVFCVWYLIYWLVSRFKLAEDQWQASASTWKGWSAIDLQFTSSISRHFLVCCNLIGTRMSQLENLYGGHLKSKIPSGLSLFNGKASAMSALPPLSTLPHGLGIPMTLTSLQGHSYRCDFWVTHIPEVFCFKQCNVRSQTYNVGSLWDWWDVDISSSKPGNKYTTWYSFFLLHLFYFCVVFQSESIMVYELRRDLPSLQIIWATWEMSCKILCASTLACCLIKWVFLLHAYGSFQPILGFAV